MQEGSGDDSEEASSKSEAEDGDSGTAGGTLAEQPHLAQDPSDQMPSPYRRALEAVEAGDVPDPFVLQEALSWQPPEQSLESLMARAQATKESIKGSLRPDISVIEPDKRYWEGSPDEFITPWGALTISEMLQHSKMGPVLNELLDLKELQKAVDSPKVWKLASTWPDQAPGGKKEGPICMVGARIFSSDPTHGGCLQFMKGTITVGQDRSTRGMVRFTCRTPDCPGGLEFDDGIAYKQLTLNAWFAKQCQLHIRDHGKDELKYLSFLMARPMTLGQLWAAKQAEDRRAALDARRERDTLQQSVKSALLAGGSGMTTPVSASLSGSSAAKKSAKSSGGSAATQVLNKGASKTQSKLKFPPASTPASHKRPRGGAEGTDEGSCSRHSEGAEGLAQSQPKKKAKKKKKKKSKTDKKE